MTSPPDTAHERRLTSELTLPRHLPANGLSPIYLPTNRPGPGNTDSTDRQHLTHRRSPILTNRHDSTNPRNPIHRPDPTHQPNPNLTNRHSSTNPRSLTHRRDRTARRSPTHPRGSTGRRNPTCPRGITSGPSITRQPTIVSRLRPTHRPSPTDPPDTTAT